MLQCRVYKKNKISFSQIKMQFEGAKEEINLSAEQLVEKERETINLQNCLEQREAIHCEQIQEINTKCQLLEQEKGMSGH